uniref:Uncharacterized protein n=1 Tax=Paramormyrops kingsleyae TaxID=1676925 RepID=A0A3B3QLH9_9TELE
MPPGPVQIVHVMLMVIFYHQQPEETKDETPATKPIVGIIYPPPEVRNIVDKTASFVARFAFRLQTESQVAIFYLRFYLIFVTLKDALQSNNNAVKQCTHRNSSKKATIMLHTGRCSISKIFEFSAGA